MRKTVATISCLLALLLACVSPLSARGDISAVFEQGKKHLHAGKYEEAIETFSQLLNMDDLNKRDSDTIRLARADAYLKKGDLKSADGDLQTVLKEPGAEGETRARALVRRAELNRRKGDEKNALKDLTDALKTPHEDLALRSASFSNRAVVFINQGEPDRAISDLNKAIELDPKSAMAFAVRGLAFLRSDDFESARGDAEKALRMEPDRQVRDLALEILKELTISSTGPASVTVPMSRDGHVFVQVRFARAGRPYRFLLDTGATYTLVNRQLLREITRESKNVTEIGKGIVSTADGATHRVTRYRVKEAFLFDLPLGEIEIHAFDGKSRRIQNLLGVKSLKSVSVSIDNSSKKAEITRKRGAE